MARRFTLVVRIVLALLALGGSGFSAAAKPSKADRALAKTWYKSGVTSMQAKRYRQAAQSFEQAYQIDPNPNLLWNIARAYEEEKDYELAILRFSTLLELDDTPAKLRKQGSERLVEIQRRLDEQKHATKVAEQTRVIEQQEAARCQVRVTEIEQQKGAEARERQATLTQRVAALEADLARARSEGGSVVPSPAPGPGQTAEVWQVVVRERERAEAGLVGWGAASLAIGIAAAGTGLGLHFYAADLRADVTDAHQNPESGVVNRITRSEALGREQDANQVETGALIALAAGSALAVTGTILLIYSAVAPGEEAPPVDGAVPALSFDLHGGGNPGMRVDATFRF